MSIMRRRGRCFQCGYDWDGPTRIIHLPGLSERELTALKMARTALQNWTELYGQWSEQMQIAFQSRLPANGHLQALEAIDSALAIGSAIGGEGK